MSREIYNEFAGLGVSVVRVLNDLKVTGPSEILENATYLQKLRDNKSTLLDYIRDLEEWERTKNQGLAGVGISAATIVNDILTLTYTDGTSGSLGNVRGSTGSTGTGVVTAGLSGENLVISFDDGTQFTLGDVVGDTGPAGVTGEGFTYGSSWGSGITYTQNTIVKRNGKVYIATTNSGSVIGQSLNKNKDPKTDTTYWDTLIDVDDVDIDGGSF
jgi:hypothetical protein